MTQPRLRQPYQLPPIDTVPIYAESGDLLRDRPVPIPIWPLPLEQIRVDGGTQARVEVSTLVVDEYAIAMQAGVIFPPVVVFRDGATYWLADGFHRVYAAKHVGRVTIPAEIHPGTHRDAVLYAVGANAKHGLRRTNADKRHAVLMLLTDPDWGQWSNREIARRCSVSADLVDRLRKTLPDSGSERKYRDRYGHISYMKTTAIGQRNEPIFDAIANVPQELRQQVQGTALADDQQALLAIARITDHSKQECIVQKLLSGEAHSVQDAVRQLTYINKQTITLQEVIHGRFPVVYADPPWQYANARLSGSAASHYPTMTTEAIAALPVDQYTTSNAVLFLWTTNPLLQDALQVMEAWEFTYRTNLVWVKNTGTYGKLGFYTHGRHELLLIGVKGSCLPKAGCLPDSVLTAKKARHSQKPDAIYTLIEQMYDGPYLELFARQTHEGWTSFGNEVRERTGRYLTTHPLHEAPVVVLVEDDPDLRELFSLVFSVAGYRLLPAMDLTDARQLLQETPCAVLVTDHQLPDGIGETLIHEIHQQGWPIRTILMSGDPRIAALADACQADGYFPKGDDLSRLVALVTPSVREGVVGKRGEPGIEPSQELLHGDLQGRDHPA